MKFFALLSFSLFTSVLIAQKKVLKRFDLQTSTLQIDTSGLDNLIIENSNANFVEVILVAESYDDQLIKIKEENNETQISFYFEGAETREVIFRKFITKRLQRANAVISIPKNRKVTIYGANVDVESKNIKNNLEIYIDNGIIKLNSPQKNATVKLYAGNVYVSDKSSSINVTSNLGRINVDDIFYEKTYEKESTKSNNSINIQTIKANIFLSTKQTQ